MTAGWEGGVWKEEMSVCVCRWCLRACFATVAEVHVFIWKTHIQKHTHACPQHSGRDSDSPPIIPRHRYYSVISTKWLCGRFRRCPPINPTLLRSSSSSSSSCRSSSSRAFFFAVPLHLPLPQLIDLYSTVVGSCHIQSLTPAWSNLSRPCAIKRKMYCVAHGLYLNWGEVNFRLQYVLNVM